MCWSRQNQNCISIYHICKLATLIYIIPYCWFSAGEFRNAMQRCKEKANYMLVCASSAPNAITCDCDEIIALPAAKKYHVFTAKRFSCFIWYYVCLLVSFAHFTVLFMVLIVRFERWTRKMYGVLKYYDCSKPTQFTHTLYMHPNWWRIQFIFHCNCHFNTLPHHGQFISAEVREIYSNTA